MKTHDSLWPSNIDTADVLVIDEPCKVTDAYYLFTDRPNIKTIKIAGHSYSRQELSNMEPHLHLGGGIIDQRPLVNPAPIPVPPVAGGPITWDPPEIWMTEEEAPGIVGQLQQAQTVIPNADHLQEIFRANQDMPYWVQTTRTHTVTDPAYEQFVEAMRVDNPTPPTHPTLAQLNEIAAQLQQGRRAVYYRQLDDIAIADGYTQA